MTAVPDVLSFCILCTILTLKPTLPLLFSLINLCNIVHTKLVIFSSALDGYQKFTNLDRFLTLVQLFFNQFFPMQFSLPFPLKFHTFYSYVVCPYIVYDGFILVYNFLSILCFLFAFYIYMRSFVRSSLVGSFIRWLTNAD